MTELYVDLMLFAVWLAPENPVPLFITMLVAIVIMAELVLLALFIGGELLIERWQARLHLPTMQDGAR